MNTVLCVVQVSLLHVIKPSDHSASNHPLPPPERSSGFSTEAYREYRDGPDPITITVTIASIGLRHYLAGSPRQQAESSSSSYGLVVHLQLLPTSSHKNAVTIGYRVQNSKLWRGLPPR